MDVVRAARFAGHPLFACVAPREVRRSGMGSPQASPVTRREIFGWCCFDFANSAFTTIIVTRITRTYTDPTAVTWPCRTGITSTTSTTVIATISTTTIGTSATSPTASNTRTTITSMVRGVDTHRFPTAITSTICTTGTCTIRRARAKSRSMCLKFQVKILTRAPAVMLAIPTVPTMCMDLAAGILLCPMAITSTT